MYLRSILLGAFLLITATAFSATPPDTTHQVMVKGLIRHAFTCTLNNVDAFRPETRNNLDIVCSSGETKKVLRSFTGISLKNILDSAGIIMERRKDRGKYYIAIKATDGYTVLYSWNDIYNNPTGDNVYLIYRENGQPITEDGLFVMICANDKVTGPRHVKWVSSIEVGRLP
ncbi:molybdopterin-dependent oxidoreductase [Chitinophaga sp. YIM B06452]|uniref:molybdopterin-dependent oxidoreductase n=1 Tax=Chitinophaga sp. YIM B06452 TaxID=3082158 RepID=UPI0031FE7919